jgi:hypothetical protein
MLSTFGPTITVSRKKDAIMESRMRADQQCAPVRGRAIRPGRSCAPPWSLVRFPMRYRHRARKGPHQRLRPARSRLPSRGRLETRTRPALGLSPGPRGRPRRRPRCRCGHDAAGPPHSSSIFRQRNIPLYCRGRGCNCRHTVDTSRRCKRNASASRGRCHSRDKHRARRRCPCGACGYDDAVPGGDLGVRPPQQRSALPERLWLAGPDLPRAGPDLGGDRGSLYCQNSCPAIGSAAVLSTSGRAQAASALHSAVQKSTDPSRAAQPPATAQRERALQRRGPQQREIRAAPATAQCLGRILET